MLRFFYVQKTSLRLKQHLNGLSHLPAIRITSITVRIIHMSEGFSTSSTEAESKFSAHVDLLQFKQGILCIRGALLIVWSNKKKCFMWAERLTWQMLGCKIIKVLINVENCKLKFYVVWLYTKILKQWILNMNQFCFNLCELKVQLILVKCELA